MLLLGCGTLLPWNVVITEKEFFDVRLHQLPSWAAVADNFPSLFGSIFTGANLSTLLLLLQFPRRGRPLVLEPFLAVLIVLVGTTVVAFNLGISGTTFTYMALPSLAVMGICAATLQDGILNLASKFTPMHIQGTVAGMAWAGVITAVLSLTSTWLQSTDTASDEPRTSGDVAASAGMYFAGAALVVVACCGGFLGLWLLPYSRWVMAHDKQVKADLSTHALNGSSDSNLEAPLLSPETAADQETPVPARPTPTSTWHTLLGSSEQLPFLLYCLALFLTSFVTLSVFPGITAFICSVDNPATSSPCAAHTAAGRLAGDLFVPVMFVAFNVGDFCGRLIASVGPWSRKPPAASVVISYALLRAAFLLVFIFCNVITPQKWSVPTLLRSDVFPLAGNLLLGMTNGHLMTIIYMHAPQLLPAWSKHCYGAAVSVCMVGGLFVGSLVSSVITGFLQKEL